MLNFSLENDHFFLDGRHLDEISKDLICGAKNEVLVVNPFVSKCDLSDTLKESCERGVTVKLITRQPDDKNIKFQQNKQEYHSSLKNSGVNLSYSKHVHAKIIVIDRSLVILSSMNFYSGSSGGTSWEAGIISLEKTVVQKSAYSILKLLNTKNRIQKNQNKKIVTKAI